ncbi:MAG: polysaccharide deacetylase family protein [Pseudomonadota bacterium]
MGDWAALRSAWRARAAQLWRGSGAARLQATHWLALIAASLSLILPGMRAVDVATRANAEPKLIALSFDDAPRGAGAFFDPADRAGRLLTTFARLHIPQVAFYVNPGRIGTGPRYTSQIDAYVAAGNVIADHTWSHPHLSATSAENYLADIDKAQAWLRGRPGYRPWFRFPFLDEGGPDTVKRDAVRAGLRARGLRHGYVTVDGSDWGIEAQTMLAKQRGQPIDMAALRDLYVETHIRSAEFSDRLMVQTLGQRVPQVLLLHETDIAALYLGDLVRALRRRGWTIVSNDRAMADPIYLAVPDTPYANGTLSEMLAWEAGIKGPRWYERNDIKLADRLFRERVLHQR